MISLDLTELVHAFSRTGGAAIGIGVDVEEIAEWRRRVPELRGGPKSRIFHPAEHDYCRSFSDPSEHYAACWSAKEAVLKAISGFVAVSLRDIEVTPDDSGRPAANVRWPGNARPVDICVSTTRSREIVLSVAVAQDLGPAKPIQS